MIRTVTAAVLIGACSCCSSAFCTEKIASTQRPLRLVDANATAETKALFINLRKLAKDKLLFGHQHTTCYGVGWRNDDNRSDVKSVTGAFPAVYGWDMWHKGTDHLEKLIREAYARGGINTISWHMENLVTGRGYLDRKGKANAVPNILPGGSHHEQFKKKLDSFVDFLAELEDEKGRPIPIIFRPWHENNQVRFWWAVRGDGRDYIKLWRFTVEYLRDKKGVHNLLYAYTPLATGVTVDNFTKPESGYPGDEYVDVIGIDDYSGRGDRVKASARLVVELAEARGKIAAIAEVGPGKGLHLGRPTFFYTKHLLEPLKGDLVAARVAYALVWRNANENHFWVPFPGHPDEKDFREFYEDPFTVFEDNLPDVYSSSRKSIE